MTASTPPLASPVVKSCLCGISYDVGTWSELERVGDKPSTIDGEVWLDLRLCRGCRSTIAVEVEAPCL
jgi:hypothetical protein